jgi:hypothetical protein
MIQLRNLDASLRQYIDNLGMGLEARGALGGSIFWVEVNSGRDRGSGKDLDHAFGSLAYACARSHADIAQRSRWARRNTIYVYGDALEEDLTALAQKTDIVGLGQCDGFHRGARLKGNHVIGTTKYPGCRLFNMELLDNDAGGTTLTIPTEQSGLKLINCDILGGPTTAIGLLITASAFFGMYGCRFLGSWNDGWSTACIDIGTGEGRGMEMINNQIVNTHATGEAINVHASRTGDDSFIKDNLIVAGQLTIDDDSDTFYVVNNDIISRGAATGASVFTDVIDINAARAARNHLTASNIATVYPVLDTAT